ncbi:MAG: hypothetical protein HYV09_06210 [Deltaproteobacteria bacterium]|nr:hypothetical protein [Deltaproteobacteria bacterium]
MRFGLPVLIGLLCACSSKESGSAAPIDDAESDAPKTSAGDDTTVDTFVKEHVYFTSTENKRIVETEATFPESGSYQSIVLHLALDCPDGRCDAWDRFGTLGIVTKKGDKPEDDTVIEVARFITPYAVAGKWDIDVTDLRPLLRGKLTMRAFIDTWVGPGSSYGNGWSLSASFEMKGGVPEKEPVAVLPIWTMHSGVYGDPAKPIATSFPEQKLTLPTGATSYAVRTLVTGHGQGNLENCAEFCPREHTVTVSGVAHKERVWRSDCATSSVPGQKGTYKLSRAGWCPGADVRPWIFDATADVASGATIADAASGATIAYDVATYVNTCRPDSPTCAGCTLGTDCKYDGGSHTEPVYFVSSLLIAYR